MYKVLREARQDNPSFTVVVSKRTHNGKYKGLDYDYMERYIAAHDDEEGSKNPCFTTIIKHQRLVSEDFSFQMI
jgi:hypothetical protein